MKMCTRNEAYLTAITVFLQGLHAPHTFKPVVGIVVAGEDVVLGHSWIVDKMIAVAVPGHEVMVDMAEEHHTAVLAHIPTGIEIEFSHTHRVTKKVEE